MDVREKLVELLISTIGLTTTDAEIYANDFIAHGVTVQEWIPVDERMPENEQDVIICAERRHYSNPNRFIRIVAKAFYTDGKHDTEHTAYTWNNDYIDMEYDEENDAYLIPDGWWESVEYGEEFSAVSDFVTHWMPMPQPPKGEQYEQRCYTLLRQRNKKL